MIYSRSLSVLLIALTTLCVSSASASDVAEQTVNGNTHIITQGGRALRDALHILENQLGCAITYEDPKYQRSAMRELYKGGPVVPRSHFVSFEYNSQEHLPKIAVIRALLNEYQHQDPSAVFTVLASPASDEIFDVVPIKADDNQGILRAQASVLEPKISLTQSDTYEALSTLVCRKASEKRGDSYVVVENTTSTAFHSVKTTLSVKDETARSVMDKLLSTFSANNLGRLSWDINRDLDEPSPLIIQWLVPPPKQLPNTVSINVESERPLADAASIMTQQLERSVIYEDAPWACDCEVIKNRASEPQLPRGGILNFAFSLQSDAKQNIEDIVKAYNKKNNPGQFAIKSIEGQAYSIYPTQSMNADESVNIIRTPILEHPVSFSVNNANPIKIVQEFCSSLATKTGKKVVVGQLPGLPVSAQNLSYMVKNKSADLALIEINKLLGKNLCWQLLYDPVSKQYELNAYSGVPAHNTP